MKTQTSLGVVALGLYALLVTFGCSTDREPGDLFAPNEVGTLVVDGALIVGNPFPVIYVSRTLSPGTTFDINTAGERDASVSIRVDSTTIEYGMGFYPGSYYPLNAAARVGPGKTYQLVVSSLFGEKVTATTTTPQQFSIADWLLLNNQGTAIQRRLATFEERGDSVYYAPENQLTYAEGLLEARFAQGVDPAYQVGIFSLDLDSDFVIDPDFFDPEDFADLERVVSSPPLEGAGGFVRLPWFAIFFEGRYKIKVFALDENWFDLVRSLPEQPGGGFGFGGTFGDNFERPIFHVNGGIGLFGSASVDSIGFYVNPRP
jgi:hypothetical protein